MVLSINVHFAAFGRGGLVAADSGTEVGSRRPADAASPTSIAS